MDLWIAAVNDDGTYGKPQKLSDVKEINFEEVKTECDMAKYSDISVCGFQNYEGTIECELPQSVINTIAWIRWYLCEAEKKGCQTCRNCVDMYRYPGFVTAEECECMAGLECDTHFDRIKNCEKYEYRPLGEPQKRNPDLDKYTYVVKGE